VASGGGEAGRGVEVTWWVEIPETELMNRAPPRASRMKTAREGATGLKGNALEGVVRPAQQGLKRRSFWDEG
jgi:hypothetical protein